LIRLRKEILIVLVPLLFCSLSWPQAAVVPAAIEGTDAINLNVTLRKGWVLSAQGSRLLVHFDPDMYKGYTVQHADGSAEKYAQPEGLNNGFSKTFGITPPSNFSTGTLLFTRRQPQLLKPMSRQGSVSGPPTPFASKQPTPWIESRAPGMTQSLRAPSFRA
jgi:hypothetical protein